MVFASDFGASFCGRVRTTTPWCGSLPSRLRRSGRPLDDPVGREVTPLSGPDLTVVPGLATTLLLITAVLRAARGSLRDVAPLFLVSMRVRACARSRLRCTLA